MKLFEPGKIGNLTIKNRVIMSAMGTMLTDLDGRLSQREIDYYTARAKGGVGLIITSAARTRLIEQLPITPLVAQLVIDAKIYASRLNELAESVHDYGAKVAVQFVAGLGRDIGMEILKRGSGAVSSSPLPALNDPNIMTRALTTEEVERLVKAFQFSAEVVRAAGVDAIEINAHAGYLCDQFMTALWNKRTDKYGGDLSGRLRFLLEIIEGVRKGAGNDFPIIVKYALTHYYPGAREIEEGLEIARRLEAAGVDALNIDAGCYGTVYWVFPTTYQQPGCMADLAAKVKEVVSIPVISVGRLEYPEIAERVLQEGKADFIASGKGLLADPEWPNKVRLGHLEDIRPCLGDHEGCQGRVLSGKYISCTVNPQCGNEREMAIIPAGKKKSVVVIGGGPGGMEAALVAALRGHRVTLIEKKDILGGNLIPASVPEFKHDYKLLLNYLSTQLEKLGVEIKLATEVKPELIHKMKPEVVFVATGGTPIIPEISGLNRVRVSTSIDILLGKKEVGSSVVVIGGGAIGCELALYLSRQGKEVIVVEILDLVASDMIGINRMHLLKLLDEAKVKVLTGVCVEEIADRGVTIVDKIGKKSLLKVDTVAIACGLAPNDKLSEAIKEIVPETYAIGDCVKPRNVMYAMREGFRFARVI